MAIELRKARPDEAETDHLRRPAWVLVAGDAVVAALGAEPYGEGCEVWFDPRAPFGDHIHWIRHSAKDILSLICFGNFALASIDPEDRALKMIARVVGFEELASDGGREVHFISTLQ